MTTPSLLPSLFLSHGAPTLPLTDTPARTFLQQLGGTLARPKAILVISAHWETAVPTVNVVDRNETIHDFGGFPRALYNLRYPAPGSPPVAARVADLLRAADLECNTDRKRGLDHGAWVPLLLMYPQADIPVLQLSVQPHLGPEHHLRVGRALAALRQEGVLIIGSGSFTHDLSEFRGHDPNDPAPAWVNDFADWVDTALTGPPICSTIGARRRSQPRTTRPKNISCRYTLPWALPVSMQPPDVCTPVRPTACCEWTFTRFRRRPDQYRAIARIRRSLPNGHFDTDPEGTCGKFEITTIHQSEPTKNEVQNAFSYPRVHTRCCISCRHFRLTRACSISVGKTNDAAAGTRKAGRARGTSSQGIRQSRLRRVQQPEMGPPEGKPCGRYRCNLARRS